TWHQTAGYRLVTHSAAPFDARNPYIVATAEIVHVADDTARRADLHRVDERVIIAAGDNDLVDATAARQRGYLLGYAAVAVVYDVGRAVLLRRVDAVWTRPDREYPSGSAQRRRRHRHKSDRSDTDDADALAILNTRELRAVESGRHHVRQHDRRRHIHV